MESVVVTAAPGSAFVYNWDFTTNKWVNFASSSKCCRIKIVDKGKEFFVKVEPEDDSKKVHEFFLPADVQITKTRDMIQFPVPDRKDTTGGKLIAIRFKDEQEGMRFMNRASEKIRGFAMPIPNEGDEPVNKKPQGGIPVLPTLPTARDSTFTAEDRYGGYHQPTLPGGGVPPSGNPGGYPGGVPGRNPYNPVDVPPPRGGGNVPDGANNFSRPPNDSYPPPEPAWEYNKPNRPPSGGIYNPNSGQPQQPNSELPRGQNRHPNEPEPPWGVNNARPPSGSKPPGGYYNQPHEPSYNPDPPRRNNSDPPGGYQNPPRNDPGPPGGYQNPPRNDPGPSGGYQNPPRNDPGPSGGYQNPPRNDLGPSGGQFPNSGYEDDYVPMSTYGRNYAKPPQPRQAWEQPPGDGYHGNDHHRGNNHLRGNMGQPHYNLDNENYIERNRQFNERNDVPNNMYGPSQGNLGPTPRKKGSDVPPLVSTYTPEPPNTEMISNINEFSQQFVDIIRSGNLSDATELLSLLMNMQKDVMGSFSMSFQAGSILEEKFSLSIMVEPLGAKSYPIFLPVDPSDTIGQLKSICHKKFKLPKECQSWLLGNQICEDKQTLKELKIDQSSQLYVYVQHPHKAKVSKNTLKEIPDQPAPKTYEGRGLEPPQQPPANQGPPPGNQQPFANQGPPPGNQQPFANQGPPPGNQRPFANQGPPPGNQQPFANQWGQPPMTNDVFRDSGMPPNIPHFPHIVGGVRVMPSQHPGRGNQNNNNVIDHIPLAAPIQAPPPPIQAPPPPEPPKVGWTCSQCTYYNLPYRPGCELCGEPRPKSYVIPPDYIPQPEERKYMDGGDDQLRLFLEQEKERQKQEAQQNYMNLLNTDVVPVVTNNEAFECPVCYCDIEPEEGIRLRNCLHLVCKECLKGSVVHSEEAVITCPYYDEDGVKCEETVEEREIRHVLDDKELENFHNRGLRQAENTDPKSFHCKTVDCPGFCFYEDEVNQFRCQICDHVNCILCKAQHENMNCKEYQEDLKIKAANDEAARQTQQMLEDMVKKGEAMHCPNCKVVVTKKVGCDWIRCLMCKTEMCWATKGPRWGPKGRGDITGGCKCGINGKKCHPKCGNCH